MIFCMINVIVNVCVWERESVLCIFCCRGCVFVCCTLNCLISKCQMFKWFSHLDLFIHLCAIRCRRCFCMLQLLLHSQMCQWIINHNTKRSNQLSVWTIRATGKSVFAVETSFETTETLNNVSMACWRRGTHTHADTHPDTHAYGSWI